MNYIVEVKRLQKLAGIIKEADEIPVQPVPAGISVPEDTPEEIPTPDGTPEYLTKEQAKQLILNTKGKFFTVTFIKKDGTTRVMNARLEVKAYLKGGELPYDPEEKGLIPAYDVKTGDYRMININTITNLKIGNNTYNIQ